MTEHLVQSENADQNKQSQVGEKHEDQNSSREIPPAQELYVASKEFEPKKEMLPAWDLLVKTWDFLLLHWEKFLPAVYVLVASSMLGLGVKYFFGTINENNISAKNILVGLGAGLVQSVLYGVFFLAFYLILKEIIVNKNNNISSEKVFDEVKDKFPNLVLVFLMLVVAEIAGFFLFIIPMFYIAVTCNFAPMISILEDTKGFKALERSWHLVEGRFWSVVWRHAFFLLVILAFLVPLIIVSALVFGFFGMANNESMALQLASSLVSAIVSVVSITYSFFIYEDLRRVKMGIVE